MRDFIISRLFQLVVTMFMVSLVVFFMVRLRGDPILVMAPPNFDEEQIAKLRAAWGFDKPLGEQYITFLTKAVRGDFGKSFQANRPAMELVIDRLGYTYLLAAAAAAIGITIAIPLGIISALKRNSLIDLLSTALASLGTAMPSFWLGLMLIIIFSVHLRMLPAFGALEPRALIMPAATLGVGMGRAFVTPDSLRHAGSAEPGLCAHRPAARDWRKRRSCCVMPCATPSSRS